jgi:hypothetical protein
MRSVGTSPRRARRIRVDTAAWLIPALVDRVLPTHVEWRETTDAVAIREQIQREFGYTAHFTHFPTVGICDRCAEQAGTQPPPPRHT